MQFVREDPEILAKNRARAAAERTNVDWSGIALLSTCLATTEFVIEEGAGMALIFVPMETTAFSRIPRHLTADATGLSNVLKETGGAIGLALFTSVLLRREVVARAGLAAHVRLTNPLVAQRISLLQALRPGVSPAAARSQALGSLNALVSREAAVRAYEQLFLLLGVMILMLLPLVFLLKVDRSAMAHVETEAE
ncbi:MAG: hypothetical protein WDO69_05375 [Pseudomonadota bacterium]